MSKLIPDLYIGMIYSSPGMIRNLIIIRYHGICFHFPCRQMAGRYSSRSIRTLSYHQHRHACPRPISKTMAYQLGFHLILLSAQYRKITVSSLHIHSLTMKLINVIDIIDFSCITTPFPSDERLSSWSTLHGPKTISMLSYHTLMFYWMLYIYSFHCGCLVKDQRLRQLYTRLVIRGRWRSLNWEGGEELYWVLRSFGGFI